MRRRWYDAVTRRRWRDAAGAGSDGAMPLRCDDGAMPSFEGERRRDAGSGGAMPSSPWRVGVKLVKLLQDGGDRRCDGDGKRS
jgi:hypothetical protein